MTVVSVYFRIQFSNFDVHVNPLGMLLMCRFWLIRSRVGPALCTSRRCWWCWSGPQATLSSKRSPLPASEDTEVDWLKVSHSKFGSGRAGTLTVVCYTSLLTLTELEWTLGNTQRAADKPCSSWQGFGKAVFADQWRNTLEHGFSHFST